MRISLLLWLFKVLFVAQLNSINFIINLCKKDKDFQERYGIWLFKCIILKRFKCIIQGFGALFIP